MIRWAVAGVLLTLLAFVCVGLAANKLNSGVWLCGNGVVGQDPCLGGKP